MAQQLPADAAWTALQLATSRDEALCGVLALGSGLGAAGELVRLEASYVALAELLDCCLLTADARLSRAPGVDCAITVVPR